MSDIAIRVKALGKQYRIGQATPYHTIREAITNSVTAPIRKIGGIRNDDSGDFWALKDVSFEVEKGEVVGVIGRNGAGKSTLLKILSRITEPTEGCAEIYGRVGSLLEVGTGFHPELTGRENIYLSAAILGMKKAEINSKFDEIVKFSEVEKFIDTPIKHYSSGMQLRLAFSVAAYLDFEILLIDEVLAVGDTKFQEKCMNMMGQIAKENRTILFVSHNLGAVENLCRTCILIENGRAQKYDSVGDCITTYLGSKTYEGRKLLDQKYFIGTLKNKISFNSIELLDINNISKGIILPSEKIKICTKYSIYEEIPNFSITFSIFTNGIRLFSINDSPNEETITPGEYESIVEIPAYTLRPGDYSIALGGYRNGVIDYVWGTDILLFKIIEEWDEYNKFANMGIINISGNNHTRNKIK